MATAPPDPRSRQYFYVLDDKGQLFLHDCKHKNFVSCLKDKAVLNMMYRLLRRVDKKEGEVVGEDGLPYAFVSPCGYERNFLRIEDRIAAMVFGSIQSAGSSFELVLGSSELRQEFRPDMLSVDCDSGRFYHTLLNHRHLAGEQGLLHGLISQQLSSMIIPVEEEGAEASFLLRWKDGREFAIPSRWAEG